MKKTQAAIDRIKESMKIGANVAAAAVMPLTPTGRYALRQMNETRKIESSLVPTVMNEHHFSLFQKDVQRLFSECADSISILSIQRFLSTQIYEDWSAGLRPYGYTPEPHYKWERDKQEHTCTLDFQKRDADGGTANLNLLSGA